MASNTVYWKDIDIELNRKPNGDIVDMTNIDAINNSLENILETMMGSRRMLPSFAVGLHKMLFEPINTDVARSIGGIILSSIEKWESRIVVDNVNVAQDIDNNRYVIYLTYHVTSAGSDQSQTFSYVLQAV